MQDPMKNFRSHLAIIASALALSFTIPGCDSESGPTTSDTDTTTTGFSAGDFDVAEDCKGCHPQHYDEWSGSMHAYAMKDPVFSAAREVGQSAYPGALDGACTKCHSPIGSRSGELPWGKFDIESISPVSAEGVGCDLCHTITSISNLGNGGIELTPGEIKYGTIQDPVSNLFHKSEYRPLYKESAYCGACHDLITGSGLELEAVFREWERGGFAITGKTCNDCHMPTYEGRATPNGPMRTLHRHTMEGADIALIDFPFKDSMLVLVTKMLRSALTMEVDVPQSVAAGDSLEFHVSLINDSTGHNVPTGVPFNRQMWLSVVVEDQSGVLYSSGQLDPNDDLMDTIHDPDLFNAQATMLRADSVPTGSTWEAVYLINPTIKAGETRVVDYGFTVPQEVAGDLTVEIVLRFRSFPPSVFRGLDLDSLLPIPIVDMAAETLSVSIQQ